MLGDSVNNIKRIRDKLNELPKTTPLPSCDTYKLSSDFCQTNNEHIKKCQFFIDDLCNRLSTFVNECIENERNYNELSSSVQNYKEFIEEYENIQKFNDFEQINERYQDLKTKEREFSSFNKIKLTDSDFLELEKQCVSDLSYNREVVDFLDTKIIYAEYSTPDEIANLENILEFLINENEDNSDGTLTG
ncbi:hypothetical protein CDIK_0428 [Cucumispora dikerogammari]|nr:hypothetical protein CDIK_0428 [Cucumispora dikerogammari]